MLEAIYKVLPVLFLLALGYLLGQRHFLASTTINDLKKLVVNVALPCSLFLAFSRVRLDVQLALIPLLVFSACAIAFWLARRFQPGSLHSRRPYPFLMTGFEAGMLGYAIYGAVYGQENLYHFGVIDLGQVTFVFFVLVPALQRLSSGVGPLSWTQTLASFLKTPVILAILGGILFNQSGLYALVQGNPTYGSLEVALSMLGGLTSPLAALVIGYEIRLERGSLGAPVQTALLRLLVWVPAGLALAIFVAGRLLALDALYQAAILVMAILPPPYVIPLFMKNFSPEDTAYAVNSLSVATLLTLPAFVAVTLAFPP